MEGFAALKQNERAKISMGRVKKGIRKGAAWDQRDTGTYTWLPASGRRHRGYGRGRTAVKSNLLGILCRRTSTVRDDQPKSSRDYFGPQGLDLQCLVYEACQ